MRRPLLPSRRSRTPCGPVTDPSTDVPSRELLEPPNDNVADEEPGEHLPELASEVMVPVAERKDGTRCSFHLLPVTALEPGFTANFPAAVGLSSESSEPTPPPSPALAGAPLPPSGATRTCAASDGTRGRGLLGSEPLAPLASL